MKKIMMFLIVLCFPIQVLAYSSEVVLGGYTIGINISSTGVMVIGFYKVNGGYLKNDLVEGDIILSVENKEVLTINELSDAITENIKNDKVNITYKRGNQIKETTLKLELVNGVYKTGLYVKDSIIGIGTLTFIDPETNTYGALGHEITEQTTSQIVEVKEGTIFENRITSIDISKNGSPGSKNAKFYYNTVYGDVTKNTKHGIYGTYTSEYDTNDLIAVGNPEEVKIGKATIYTVLDNETVESFEIEITKINENAEIKNILFEITDEDLLKRTGGIVQGMSGSPIVQNGKLIGAVTHVITDNVASGYGIFITTMLEESEK